MRRMWNTLSMIYVECLRKKHIVWQCISRLDHGSCYCKNFSTMHEESLHKAIVKAINDFYNCNEDVAEILKSNAESVLLRLADNEIQNIKNHLKEIDEARNNFINLIATGACGEDSLDGEFAELFAEEKTECIKVMNKTEILIIFKGGYEVRISVEK